MKKLQLLVIGTVLITSGPVVNAEDYLLDASAMAVGATAGENLVVKEGCLDPSKTSCTDTERVQWLAVTSPTKVGNVQVVSQLTGDFEVAITADFIGESKGIKILTGDNKGISLNFFGDAQYSGWSFGPNNLGEGGSKDIFDLPGWNGGNAFNEVKISVQQGVANVYVNGQVPGKPITFDANTVFERVAIEGIKFGDRLSEVKVRGIQGGSLPTDCPTIPDGGTTVSGVAATINSDLSIHIPNATYTPLLGLPMNLWADLVFMPSSSGELQWKIGNYGVNP